VPLAQLRDGASAYGEKSAVPMGPDEVAQILSSSRPRAYPQQPSTKSEHTKGCHVTAGLQGHFG
jgi:hypothetical protein